MQIILLERIEKLGQMGDVVTVKPGYARNYLLPQGKARRATKENIDIFHQQRTRLEAENLKRRDEAENVGAKLQGLSVTLIRQAGEPGQLYGSVNKRDLAEAITEAGFSVSRSQVILDQMIKSAGVHQVKIRLHPEVSVTVNVIVARSKAEAEAQTRTGQLVSTEQQQTAEEAVLADRAEVLARIEAAEAAEGTETKAKAAGEDATEQPAEGVGEAKAEDDSGPEKAKEG